jgi:hypothetical protein
MSKIDEAMLRSKSIQERYNLWINAQTLNTDEARRVQELIENLDLPYLIEEGVRLDDPICRKMSKIIFSPEGREAAITATNEGFPALKGIDPLLSAALGPDYRKENDATLQAGYLVTNMMRIEGFEKSGQRPLPNGSVAKTGAVFTRKKKTQ